ncbi:haloacid dehalogenase [Psychromonas marina]|uniref:Haloacid dehalogenase n=1 Tax=Psychromonas marina TaxID=88364 RepID=A0ABQ6E0U3_9GAMM|nr:HAD-IIB family hydrolase [Psychromonas marina]GLS90966.1 haloacid dehalogenase [Psychromonas marina]
MLNSTLNRGHSVMPKPLTAISSTQAKSIKWLFTDVDDTLTWEGSLPLESMIALNKLSAAGVRVVPVTGACAGWCDQIAKLWPVHGVIGENGAFWMQKNSDGFSTQATIALDTMKLQQEKLIEQLNILLLEYPDIGFANDQPFRYCDVAINLSQDREPISDNICRDLIAKITKLTVDGHPVNATESSIHLNVWVGSHSKRLTTEAYLLHDALVNKIDAPINLNEIAYIGDSLNDESMFAWLPMTFGVRNIEPILSRFKAKPAYITNKNGGYGFAELAEVIVEAKKSLAA